MTTFTENISIAVLGPVSVGKSTFINSVFCDTMSEMKRKRTTMLPQIYQVTHDSYDSTKTIIDKNTKSNNIIFEKRNNGTFNVNTDFNEILHNVKPMDDFIILPNNLHTYSILDMPGLNDQFSDIYYDYIRNNSKYIDIYLVIYDVNSSLNTTDEVKILQFVVNEVKKNNSGFIYVIINKCNDFEFSANGFKINEPELKELYEQAHNTVKQICKDVNYAITPMCTSELYVYRALAYNKSCDIAEIDLDRIIREEVGKNELKKLKTYETKKKFIQAKIQKDKEIYNSGIVDCGYKFFKTNLQKIISDNFDIFVNKHIELSIEQYVEKIDIVTYNENFILNTCDFFTYAIERLTYVSKKILKITTNPSDIINKFVSTQINLYTEKLCDDSIEHIKKLNTKVSPYFDTILLDNSIITLQTQKVKILKESIRNKYNIEKIKLLYDLNELDFNDYGKSLLKELNIDFNINNVYLTSTTLFFILNNMKKFISDVFIICSVPETIIEFCEIIIFVSLLPKINNNVIDRNNCKYFINTLNTLSDKNNKKIKYLINLFIDKIERKIIEIDLIEYCNARDNGHSVQTFNNVDDYLFFHRANSNFEKYSIFYDIAESFVDFLDNKFNVNKVIENDNKNYSDEEQNDEQLNVNDSNVNDSEIENNSNIEKSDSGEEYLSDDTPDVIYKKALRNTSKKTIKIMKNSKTD